jgi:cell division protein ZapA
MSEAISISLRLGNRQYKLKVAPEHEEHVRKSIQVINDKMLELKKTFTGRDEQDYMAMTLLDYITRNDAPQHVQIEKIDDAIMTKLNSISNLLDS